MQELLPGLWTWTARHPEWLTPDDGWGPDVRSYALDTASTLVLIDPLSPPAPVDGLAAGKEVAVLLTVYAHERSAAECVERLGARVLAPAKSLDDLSTPATGYAVGDTLPGGVEARTGFWPNEATLWLPEQRALVTGDVLLGERGLSIPPDDWLEDAATPEQVREGLRPLLDLPVELVLPTHGEPVLADARAQLAAALELSA
jgi:glyoxylase-like metal-dependent hydrolase (beta-lactamase superfamily II)